MRNLLGLVLSLILLSPVPEGARGEDTAKGDSQGGAPIFSPAGFPFSFDFPNEARDETVPTPQTALGYPLGHALTSSESVSAYVKSLAAKSRRIRLESYGTTPEGRELLLAFVSTPANLARLSEIRKNMETLSSGTPDPAAAQKLAAGLPAVIWIACSIHGDEPAGSEAGMALLYWLAASRQPETENLLQNLVIIIDPNANPDGKALHAAWWRSVAGTEPDPDPLGVENTPRWPDGRTNHNGFDLNRDWAWATQPETRARIMAFRNTQPQVYIDLHEMNPENSYFFPPDAEPVNVHVAPEIRKWLDVFGRANARAFDERGWSYFVREVFDRFYPGYGDSWPSFHGAVGMTFETGGSSGLAYRRKDGTVLTFKERIVKHFTAARTALFTAAENRNHLLLDFAAYFRNSVREGKRVYVIPAGQDPARLRRMARLLTLQGIRVEKSTAAEKGIPAASSVLPEGSLIVDTAQPFGRFAETLLEPAAELSERFIQEERKRLLREEPDRFFDVTAWSLPIAFGLESFSVTERQRLPQRTAWVDTPPAVPSSPFGASRFGWLFPGLDSASRLAAGRLLERGIKVSVTTVDARIGSTPVPPGSFLVKRNSNSPQIEAEIKTVARESEAEPIPLASAWTDEGPALGSRTVIALEKPRVAVLLESGASIYSAGAILDSLGNRLGIRAQRRRPGSIADGGLKDVNVLILPHAAEEFAHLMLQEDTANGLRRFVEGGGVVIGIRGSAQILREKPLQLSSSKPWEPAKKPEVSVEKPETPRTRPGEPPDSADLESARNLDQQALSIPGAALKTKAVSGHPLLFGTAFVPNFLVSEGRTLTPLTQPRANVVSVATKDPLASGFAWKEALEQWTGAPLVQVEEVGKGKVVSFASDPVFRGIWAGTEIVFLNAVLLLPSL